MTRPVLVVGLGQPLAGDDGVGPAVVAALPPLPYTVETLVTTDPLRLADVLGGRTLTILVDAAVDAGPPGTVHVLEEAQVLRQGIHPVSSHALDVLDVLDLVRTVRPENLPARLVLVLVAITRPVAPAVEMTAPVQHAVAQAVQRVMSLLGQAPRF